MTEHEKEIIIDDLEEKGKEIAEIIGLESYLKLAKIYSGDTIYIGSYEKIVNKARNRAIRSEYYGLNGKQLASKYKLSRRRIQQLSENEDTKKYRELRRKSKEYIQKNQMNIFDDMK